jgi:hypothetical protein
LLLRCNVLRSNMITHSTSLTRASKAAIIA